MLLVILVVSQAFLGLRAENDAGCQVRNLDTPVAAQDGDFIIGGFFQIGRLEYSSGLYGDQKPFQLCSYRQSTQYNVQKAIILRKLIDKENERFKRDFNKTLGYEMYDTCMNSAVTARVSTKMARGKKVIGVSGVDMKTFLERSASITASFHIPTFVYMFNEEELMITDKYPTLFSMIDTEVNEAEVTIRFLEKMGYKYMDIWFHQFSQEMAEHIYNNYLKKVGGCGRIADVTYKSHLPMINQTYNETGGSPSQVQLILQNSASTTRAMLEEMIEKLGFENKIFILGLSNGRFSYLDDYAEILKNSRNNTLILPLPDPLNTDLPKTFEELNEDWRDIEERDYIDIIYKDVQRRRCSKDSANPKTCSLTSWIPYMIGGIKLILESLHDSLSNLLRFEGDCQMDYKTELYKEILKENRTIEVELEENVTMPIRISNKTLNTGYRIGVYRTETKTFDILGRAFISHLEVTNDTLLRSISGYNKTCSHTCRPGTHRLFDDTVQYLPCCWTCERCKIHQYSTENNSHVCDACHESMSSTLNHTACILVPDIFIAPHSPIFIAGGCCIPIGVIAAIAFGVLVFRNEERPVIKASDPGYLYMILLSLIVGYMTAFTPLLKPSERTCHIEYYSFGIFATMISINLLYKCVKVYDIFAAAKNFTSPKLGLLLKRTGQTALNLACLAITAAIFVIDTYTGGGPSWTFDRYQESPHTSRYLMCTTTEKKGRYLIIPMVIPALSLLTTLVLAFKMRHFPHNFRESLNIFCATFVVLLCSIMFLAGYSFSSPEVRPILRAIVVFLSSTAFLFCIFIPKMPVLFDRAINIEEEKTRIQERLRRYTSISRPSIATVTAGVMESKLQQKDS
ncbi:hypothetical protein ACHWQZ_G012117 [Mnemiopsis leidyi]